MDHVDECSCVGYAVSNFDLLSELWENTQIQISFKLDSFIVIIVCFYSYKLIIRSTFCINLMLYIFEGVVVSQWSSFHFVFLDMKLSFFLVVGQGSVAVSDMLTSFTFHFSSLNDWLILNQTQSHKQDFWRTNVYSSKA